MPSPLEDELRPQISLALAPQNLSVKDQRQVFQAFQTMWSLLSPHGSVSIKLYRQKQAVGWIWPEGCSLPNPDLVQFL